MLDNLDRKQYVADLEFNIPPYDRPCIQGITELIEARGRGVEPRNLAIIGEAGAGKTKVAEKVLRAAQEQLCPKYGQYAAIYILAPGKASARNLIEKLLHALNDQFHSRDTIGGGETRISELLKACQTAVVVIDEAHHMAEGKTGRGLWELTEVAKNIGQIANVIFVFAGLPSLLNLRDSNPQFQRRLRKIVKIAPFDWRDAQGNENIRMLLHTIDTALPFEQRADLDGTELAFRIYQATSGIVGLIIELVKAAANFAIDDKKAKQLTLAHFNLAYLDGPATTRGEHINPFGSELPPDWEPIEPGAWLRTKRMYG